MRHGPLILKRTSDPSVEPVSLTEAKLHLRVDINDDDTLISALIQAAREACEKETRRSFITQTWTLGLEAWPHGHVIELPRPPLQSVTSITYTTEDDAANTLASSLYGVETQIEPGRVVLKYGEDWPSDVLQTGAPITVTYVAGYGATSAAVPEIYRSAVLLMVAHLYENREPVAVSGAVPKEVPRSVKYLLHIDRGSFQ